MNIEKPTFKHLCYMYIQQLTNFPFIEEDFDAITDYQFLCKVVHHLNEVIKNSNLQNDAITNLYNAFIELKDYVDNYFDNNLPDLVNNKLDEMAEDGTLENLLNNKLHLIRVYNTYQDLLLDKNTLVNDMKIVTLGYYNIGDNGKCEYYVTNTSNSNIYQIDLDNGLYLEIINNKIYPEMLGAYGDGTHDDYTVIQECLNNFNKIYLNNKTYLISDTLDIQNELIGFNTIIKANSSLEDKYMSKLHNDVTLKNIKFDCNDYALGCVYYTDDSINTDIDNCIFTGAKKYVNEELVSLNSAIYLSAKNVNMTNSKVIDNYGHGARLYPIHNHSLVNIDNCEFSRNGVTGESVGVGLVCYSSVGGTYYDKVTIQNSFATGNANSGIAPTTANNSIVTNCVANNNGEHGFVLQNTKNCEISNCIAKNNVKYGIRVQGDYLSETEYTGVVNFLISNNYLLGSGIDLDNHIRNGVISDNLIEFDTSLSSETSKGIRIGRANRDDLIENLQIINNKIKGYATFDSIHIFCTVDNSIILDNYVDNKKFKGAWVGNSLFYRYFNDYNYSDESNNKLSDYDDFSNWDLGADVSVENNVFSSSGIGNNFLCYKTISISEIPRYVAILIDFEKVNEEDVIKLNTAIRFRNTSLIAGTTFGSLYEVMLDNRLCRIFDLSRLTTAQKNLIASATGLDVFIAVQDTSQIKINQCIASFSDTPPLLYNKI